ncbi:MAG: response regulator, partial [Candidatus Electrothrix sp. AR4]|nr:response regulator [Candidatus Electrothrix sp. AR4]
GHIGQELRTPLNSLLLLAQTLESNRHGNLTEDDIESVRVIHNSGNELLALINDILDLSKIEAGQMVLVRDTIPVADLLTDIKLVFQHLADEKGLKLHFTVAAGTPRTIESDRKRLDQVLKNFLSNALKFTEKGEVTVSVSPAPPDFALQENTIAIAVQDSGVGIPPDKQKIIFEAFQQADGGTARKYGGTGLGLSIARDLADLLGGKIRLDSKKGEGSTFSLYLPATLPNQDYHKEQKIGTGIKNPPKQDDNITKTTQIEDDRHDLHKNDRTVLVIEDDPRFSALLRQQCHEKGLKYLAAPTGEDGLRLAASYAPIAIILDLKLPGISGWSVLELLKKQIETRHIPVHIMSVDDVGGMDALRKGAVEALKKPISRDQLEIAFLNIEETARHNIKTLLVAEQDARQRKAIVTLIGNSDVHSAETASGGEVLNKLQTEHYDCLIMGLDFPDMTGSSLLQRLQADKTDSPPIIIYTDKKLSRKETAELRQYASSIIIKGAMSEERLLDESALFLHRMISGLPERKQRMIRNLHEDDVIFQG